MVSFSPNIYILCSTKYISICTLYSVHCTMYRVDQKKGIALFSTFFEIFWLTVNFTKNIENYFDVFKSFSEIYRA